MCLYCVCLGQEQCISNNWGISKSKSGALAWLICNKSTFCILYEKLKCFANNSLAVQSNILQTKTCCTTWLHSVSIPYCIWKHKEKYNVQFTYYICFYRFVLMVKKGYRNPPYHNWMHAYTVAQFCYQLIKNLQLENYLE